MCVCMSHMCGWQWRSEDKVGATVAEVIASCVFLYMSARN